MCYNKSFFLLRLVDDKSFKVERSGLDSRHGMVPRAYESLIVIINCTSQLGKLPFTYAKKRGLLGHPFCLLEAVFIISLGTNAM